MRPRLPIWKIGLKEHNIKDNIGNCFGLKPDLKMLAADKYVPNGF